MTIAQRVHDRNSKLLWEIGIWDLGFGIWDLGFGFYYPLPITHYLFPHYPFPIYNAPWLNYQFPDELPRQE